MSSSSTSVWLMFTKGGKWSSLAPGSVTLKSSRPRKYVRPIRHCTPRSATRCPIPRRSQISSVSRCMQSALLPSPTCAAAAS